MNDRTLLLTRPEPAARRFVLGLDPACLAGVHLCYAPVMEIVSTGADIDLTAYGGVIFTSGNAVDLAPVGERMLVFCVGAGTAAQAKRRGWNVSWHAQDADDLVRRMVDDIPNGPFLHIAGAHRRGYIEGRLGASGLLVDVVTVYEQRLLSLSDAAQALLIKGAPVIVPLFSPRSATQFLEQAEQLDYVHVVTISEAVAEVVRERTVAGLHCVSVPDGNAMREAVEMLLRRDSLP